MAEKLPSDLFENFGVCFLGLDDGLDVPLDRAAVVQRHSGHGPGINLINQFWP
jgi:hypothetical protein